MTGTPSSTPDRIHAMRTRSSPTEAILGVGTQDMGSPLGNIQRPGPVRRYAKSQRLSNELAVLIDACKDDWLPHVPGVGARAMHQTATEWWCAIDDKCWSNGVHRSSV